MHSNTNANALKIVWRHLNAHSNAQHSNAHSNAFASVNCSVTDVIIRDGATVVNMVNPAAGKLVK